MKRDIELIRIAIAAGLVALAILAGLFVAVVLADTGPALSPPELATYTPPAPHGTPDLSTPVLPPTPDPYPYPPPATATTESYPGSAGKAQGWRVFVPLLERD